MHKSLSNVSYNVIPIYMVFLTSFSAYTLKADLLEYLVSWQLPIQPYPIQIPFSIVVAGTHIHTGVRPNLINLSGSTWIVTGRARNFASPITHDSWGRVLIVGPAWVSSRKHRCWMLRLRSSAQRSSRNICSLASVSRNTELC